MSRHPGPVPERWMWCPRKARELIVSKFMAFKTPLSERFDDQVPQECRFPPQMLFQLCKKNKIKFGLWIDLTNTTRFYNETCVKQENCKYVKLQCRGHGETPSKDQTNAFIQLVHMFITKNPLEAIAVHCTHGFNRTGFLIVSYMVEKLDCGLEVALSTFARARPPGIYKEDYIVELYRRYHDVDDAPPPPELPEWCFEDNAGGNCSTSDDANSSEASTSSGSKIPNKRRKVPQFMEGVPGVTAVIDQPLVFELQKKVRRMCNWKNKSFPGLQPVSMDRQNIKLLHEKPYMVSWKADGMRYLMLIDGRDGIFFFDRDFNAFKVEGLRFPYRKNLHEDLANTLIDGEMVIDKFNGTDIPRFLAYDVIKFFNQDVGSLPFQPGRLQCLENEIIKPRHAAIEQGIINRAKEPFSVRKKDFWEITKTSSLLGEKFAKELSHEPDGLIFQPAKDPYMPGPCQSVLKWKPLSLNSVDFRMRIEKIEGQGLVTTKVCSLYVGQLALPFSKMKYKKFLKDYHNKIIECKFENNEWVFMRERTDKSFPNSYETAVAVLESIKAPVTKETLLEYIDLKRYNDSEMMPPPKKIKR